MINNQHYRALEKAAAPALAAIAEDARRAPKWLRPLFDKMAELLFEPDLELDQILKAAGFSDPDVWIHLREEVEQAPWSYLRDGRLETAAHLLYQTRISISEIGHLVGYDSASTFRRPLQEFLGMPPSRYRRQAPRLLARARRAGAPDGASTTEYWRRMLAGELSDAEARELDAYLGRLAPASAPAPAGEDDARWARLRRTLAEGLADPEGLAILSFAEQRRLVRDAVWFPDGTFFELLCERSLSRGRSIEARRSGPGDGDSTDGRQRAIELMLLAIDSLAANRMLETQPGRAALAWARLARARWHAGDLAGAEQDLERAANDVTRAEEEDLLPAWEAERSRIAVAFQWLRGDRLSALDLAAHMIAEQRQAAEEPPDAGKPASTAEGATAEGATAAALFRALLLRAELRAAVAELEPSFAGVRARPLANALADLEEAQGLLDTAEGAAAPSDPVPARLRRAMVSLWARLLVLAGNRGERLAPLPKVRAAAACRETRATPLLHWLEGHAGTGAETLWRLARKGFAEAGDELWGARVTLDLARLCLAEERPGEAAALASQLASTLGAAAASPEDLSALEPLGRAAPFATVTGDDLDGAERLLTRLELQRRTELALDLAW